MELSGELSKKNYEWLRNIFNSFTYHEDANENYLEILSHQSQNG